MEPYTGPTKRTYKVILLSCIILPLGYFGIFYFQTLNGPIKSFENKYSQENRKKICRWGEDKTYLDCLRKDFYSLIRSTGPYQSQLAFIFITDVFRYDRDHQVTERGKIFSHLDFIDLGINFLEIERRARIHRQKLNVPGIMMAKMNKDRVLQEIFHFSDYFKKMENNYGATLQADPIILSRFKRLKKSFERLSPSLKD